MGDVKEDNFLSFRNTKKEVELAVKKGELTNSQAKDILEGAKHNYSNATAQKTIDRRSKK